MVTVAELPLLFTVPSVRGVIWLPWIRVGVFEFPRYSSHVPKGSAMVAFPEESNVLFANRNSYVS